MNEQKPRRAGRLHIGTVAYTGGVFTVDMVFESASYFPGEDEMKSATRAAQQHFYRLLHENGFHSHGSPECMVKPNGSRSITIILGCQALQKKPAIIMLRDPNAPMEEEKKTNGDGGDQVDDKT